MAVAFVATACTSVAPPPLREVAGRFAATSASGAAAQNATGRFVLRIEAQSQTLDLSTPIGTTIARLEVSPTGARLRGAGPDGAVVDISGPSADALMEQLLGFALPVGGMADWIDARPVPGVPAEVRMTPAGAVESIAQSGWLVTVDEHFVGESRPRRLTLRRLASEPAGAPPILLRLVIDGPPPGAGLP